jgi:hypothetical protein
VVGIVVGAIHFDIKPCFYYGDVDGLEPVKFFQFRVDALFPEKKIEG